MLRNIHNLMTDLLVDVLGLKESSLAWGYYIENSIGHLDIALPEGTFPPGIRVPKMICKMQFSRESQEESQICFLAENSLFQHATMTRVLQFFSENTVEV